MSIRHILHKNKLQDFIKWCYDNEIHHEIRPNQFEVLRILTDGKPIIFYAKHEPTRHITVPTEGMKYVNRFLRERRNDKS